MITDLARIGPTLIPPPPHPNTAATMDEARELMIAWVRWESAEYDARAKARAQALPSRGKVRERRSTTVFSVRLDDAEVAALERQAALDRVQPSALARRLIRRGLADRDHNSLTTAVGAAVRSLEDVALTLSDAME